MENIEIGFSFPKDGSIQELIGAVKSLINETTRLKDVMYDTPIDELNAKINQYSKSIGDAAIQIMGLNQSQTKEQEQLVMMSSLLEDQVSKMRNAIEVKKMWSQSSQAAQKSIDSLNNEMVKAANQITVLQAKISELNKLQQEGNNLTKTQENQYISIKGKIEALGKSIQDNSNILSVYNSRSRETAEQMEESVGYIQATKEKITELTSALTGNSEADKQNVAEIAELNVALSYLQKQIGGTLEEESALNKVIEQNIILTNKTATSTLLDVDAKAKWIIAQNEQNVLVEQRVAELTSGYTKEEQMRINDLTNQSIAWKKSEEMAEQSYNKRWMLAEENAQKEKIRNNKLIEEAERRELLGVQAVVEAENKKVIARQKAFDKAWIEGEKWQALQAKNAEAAQLAANKSIFSWESFSNVFQRMGLRMVASLIWWTLIISAATELYEWYTKIDEATQRTLDSLKDYNEGFQTLLKALTGVQTNIKSDIEFDSSKARSQVAIMQAQNLTLDQRFLAYKELMSIAPHVFDEMDKEGFKIAENTQRMKDQIETMMKMIFLNDTISNGRATQKQIIDSENKNKQETDEVRTRLRSTLLSSGRSTPETVEADIDSNRTHYGRDRPGNFSGTQRQKDFMTLNYLEDEKQQLEAAAKKADKMLADMDMQRAALMGNTKDKKGRHKHVEKLLPIKLAEEKASFSQSENENKNEFDDSDRSLNNKLTYYKKDEDLTETHYSNNLAIIKKYGKIDGESNAHLKERREKALADEQQKLRQIKEERLRDLEAFRGYEAEKAKVIDETDKKLAQNNRDNEKRINEFKDEKRKADLQHEIDSDPDLIGAAFGTSGQRRPMEYRNLLRQKDSDILKDKQNISISSKEGIDAQTKIFTTGNKLSNLDKKPDIQKTDDELNQSIEADKAKSPEQLKIDRDNREAYFKAIEDKKQADAKYVSDYDKLQKDQAEKTRIIDLHVREGKIAVAKGAMDATEKIANSQFDAQRKRIQQQMQDIQSLAQFEITLAGNNSAAKLRIAKTEHDKLLALKRKQAENEKESALFSIGVNTAKGIISAIADYPGPYGLLLATGIGTAGIVQAANVSSERLPSYKIGRKGGKSEIARINEEGFEFIENNGKFRVEGKGKESIVNLNEGDIVHTHTESKNFLKNLLFGNGVINQRDDLEKNNRNIQIQKSITKAEIKDAMIEAIKTLPKPEIVIPADHIISRFNNQQKRMGL